MNLNTVFGNKLVKLLINKMNKLLQWHCIMFFLMIFFCQVQSMIKYGKSLADESLFHPLLKCMLGRVISMATGQCKRTLCEIVTEFVLPDLWKVTRLPGNYEISKVFTQQLINNHFRHMLQITHFCSVIWHLLSFK